MGYYGSWKIDDALTFTANTHLASSGAATDADAVPSYRVYEDETATPILTGSMALLDSANTAGFYSEQITLSAANGFEKGKSYNIYISATVSSVVGTISHNFQMEAEVDANVVSDKTGYALTQTFPTNFADMAITVTTGQVTVGSMATDAVDAAALATDAVDEIADGVWDEVLTGATHNVVNSAGRRLRQLQEAGTYAGAIWIDTVNGTAGTTAFENGTDTLPVDTIADANTLAAAVGISRFRIAPGSTITLAATQANQMFEGQSWTLALGGQSIDGSTFIGADVSGIATNTAGRQNFIDCNVGAVTLPSDTHVDFCGLSGTQTLGEAGDYFYDHCHSDVAGTGTVTIDFGAALNASNLNVRHHSGGTEIQNMGAGTGSYNMSLEGNGQLVINANCSATSTVAIRGNFTVTDNAGGAVTLSDDARYDVAQINAEVDTALIDYGANTTTPPTVEAIRIEMDSNSTQLSGIKTETDKLDANRAEPGQGAPGASVSLLTKVDHLYKAWRNKKTVTATTIEIRDDGDTQTDSKITHSDDATTYTKGEVATGP